MDSPPDMMMDSPPGMDSPPDMDSPPGMDTNDTAGMDDNRLVHDYQKLSKIAGGWDT
jgi:hypothetical protein